MARTVRVELKERSYDIQVGTELPVGGALDGESGAAVLIVTDSNVDPLYGDLCDRQLTSAGCRVTRAVIPAGEASKDLHWAGVLYGKAVAAGLDRKSVIVALGGGVVGDLAGFVAATYLRGVRFVQIPTTLLAMVDSSVGGKTGINLPEGKNLVGCFHQPARVVADLATLRSLPQREYVSGLAEVVKYGVIWDARLFRDLEASVRGLLDRNTELLDRIVARCCEIKAEVVAMDEHEVGPRAILNFGHTLGHAIEKAAGYGHLLHGEAVSIGMVYAAYLSTRLKGFADDDYTRLVSILKSLRLPVKTEGGAGAWGAVRDAMTADKKSLRRVPRFVLAERLGGVVIGCEVGDAELKEAWDVVS